MRNIRRALWAIPAGLSLLWLLAALPLPDPLGVMQFRSLLVQYSGVLSMGAMSVAMILALRLRWLERVLDGLDKSYRLHKWLGIMALVTTVTHWLAVKTPKWLVEAGLLVRGKKPTQDAALLGPIESILRDQRELAEGLGDLFFKVVVVLIALALIKRVPYRWFVSSHRLIAAAYLVLVFHAVVLMRFDMWLQPVGLVMAVLLAGGTYVAVLSIIGRIGHGRRVNGTIETVETIPDTNVTETTVALQPGWAGHKAGQFAFVTFDSREGHHPFTIASDWNPAQPRLTIVAKALGDYTATLADTLKPGAAVTVEGPYGCFTFEALQGRQIWVAGGIGITPFLARMKEIARHGSTGPVDLIHTARALPADLVQRLEATARAANVRLHLLLDDRDGLLDGARLRQLIPGWQEASIWFCGPAGFGQTLRRDLETAGLPKGTFHQELFDMR